MRTSPLFTGNVQRAGASRFPEQPLPGPQSGWFTLLREALRSPAGRALWRSDRLSQVRRLPTTIAAWGDLPSNEHYFCGGKRVVRLSPENLTIRDRAPRSTDGALREEQPCTPQDHRRMVSTSSPNVPRAVSSLASHMTCKVS